MRNMNERDLPYLIRKAQPENPWAVLHCRPDCQDAPPFVSSFHRLDLVFYFLIRIDKGRGPYVTTKLRLHFEEINRRLCRKQLAMASDALRHIFEFIQSTASKDIFTVPCMLMRLCTIPQLLAKKKTVLHSSMYVGTWRLPISNLQPAQPHHLKQLMVSAPLRAFSRSSYI